MSKPNLSLGNAAFSSSGTVIGSYGARRKEVRYGIKRGARGARRRLRVPVCFLTILQTCNHHLFPPAPFPSGIRVKWWKSCDFRFATTSMFVRCNEIILNTTFYVRNRQVVGSIGTHTLYRDRTRCIYAWIGNIHNLCMRSHGGHRCRRLLRRPGPLKKARKKNLIIDMFTFFPRLKRKHGVFFFFIASRQCLSI